MVYKPGDKREKHQLLVVFLQLLAASTDLGQLAEPLSFFWMELLIHEWCLQVDSVPATDSCELNCRYPDTEDWNQHPHPPTISKQMEYHLPASYCDPDAHTKDANTKICSIKSPPIAAFTLVPCA
ncbi:5,10-methenyltetrahydrofolate synthetase (5-formyltetrahydrofolate cyclo-ligase), isoform CRA_a [Rattus norvegicus]|uniref:5,10-methenyltetrahydrofolate synthetase (5-formyltetrahydrofolate cyclo-ligase), isoform CRA_a n=1 Tax=Rattus norvegicus TaxID=10116 RepID=A6I202_RAT|nr:5,10-methenyltetrahydrofolate synthetase (5-formyltetrahydrofolate cyclo-ligase), isoform CRA_a [Rattus norvegicus]